MGRTLEPEVMAAEEEALAYDELDRLFGEVLFQGFAESAVRMGVTRGRVLDVGTGPGWIAIRTAKLSPEITIDAIDLSENMLRLARRNADAYGVGRRIRFLRADAKRMPFPDGAFDLVICHNMLHQLPEPLAALREIKRVAKPEGAILARDVRRLPGLLMGLALPFYTLRYGRTLRRLTYDSFYAGLTYREFKRLIRRARIPDASHRAYFITHIGLERPARTSEPVRVPTTPASSWVTRLAKSLYLSPLPHYLRA